MTVFNLVAGYHQQQAAYPQSQNQSMSTWKWKWTNRNFERNLKIKGAMHALGVHTVQMYMDRPYESVLT